MQIVNQMSAGSTQSVVGTAITAGGRAKLVRISSPPSTASAGTLLALPT